MLIGAGLAAAVAVVMLVLDGGPSGVAHAFDGLAPDWVAVAFGAQFAAFAGYALAYRRLIVSLGGPRIGYPLVARLVATGFGAFAPGGGFAIDYRALQALEDNDRAAAARVLALGALEYVVIAPAACAAAIVMLIVGSRAMPSVMWPWAIAVPIGFGVGFWAAARSESLLDGRRGKVWRMLGDALGGIDLLRRMATRPARFLPALLGITVYWAGEVVSLWASLRAVGPALPATSLIVGLATGYALTRRSMPLGGAGITEALLSFALVWVGLDLAVAVAGVVIYRLFSFVLPMVPGLRARRDVVDLIEPGLATESGNAPESAPRPSPPAQRLSPPRAAPRG